MRLLRHRPSTVVMACGALLALCAAMLIPTPSGAAVQSANLIHPAVRSTSPAPRAVAIAFSVPREAARPTGYSVTLKQAGKNVRTCKKAVHLARRAGTCRLTNLPAAGRYEVTVVAKTPLGNSSSGSDVVDVIDLPVAVPNPTYDPSVPDTEAPRIAALGEPGALSVSSTVVDTTEGGVEVPISIGMADAQSGVDDFQLVYKGPGDTVASTFGYVTAQPFSDGGGAEHKWLSGDIFDGIWQDRLYFPAGAKPGTYQLSEVSICDHAQNCTTYGSAQQITDALGYDSSFDIVNTTSVLEEPTPTNGPTFLTPEQGGSFSLTATTVNTLWGAVPAAQVTVHGALADQGFYVKTFALFLRNENGQVAQTDVWAYPFSDPHAARDADLTGIVHLPANAPSEGWHVTSIWLLEFTPDQAVPCWRPIDLSGLDYGSLSIAPAP